MMKVCRPLEDYAKFVESVRTHRKKVVTLEEAVDAAISELESDSSIKAFLTAHKAEVKFMCITEYDEERTIAEFREEGKEEGRAEGLEEGRAEGRAEGGLDMLVNLVKKGLLMLAQAADEAHMTVPEFQAQMGAQA